MKPLRFVALALVASLALALSSRADDKTDKEKAQAAKELKAKRAALSKMLKEIVAADAGEEQSALDKATNDITDVRLCENKDAAQALVRLAVSCRHEQLFRQAKDELAKFQDEEPIKALAAILKPKDPKSELKKIQWQERALIADVFGSIESPLTVEPLCFALDDADILILNPAIASAGKKKDTRVFAPLIALVGRFEKNGGWEYYRARQALVDLTGQDFTTQKAWKEWWDGNKDTFSFDKKGDAKEAKTQERVSEKQKPTFFGTEVKSNRCIFIVDVSGSMQSTDPVEGADDPEIVKKLQEKDPVPERQRIERVRKELLTAIPLLDKTTRFNIMLFSDAIRLWKEDLVDATDDNKKNALEFIRAMKEGGGTYTDDAFKRAFSMREVDTFYFLSDGAPQKKVGNPGEQNLSFQRELIKVVIDMVKRETRFRRVVINSFGLCGLGVWHKKWGNRSPLMSLDPKDIIPLREFMQQVADITGGQYKPI